MGKTTQVAADRAFDQTKTVLPAEIARGVYMRNAPSLQALKLMHLLIAKAGGRMADDVRHELRLADIKEIDGMRNHSRETLVPLFEELRAVVVREGDPADEAQRVVIGGLLDQAILDRKDPISGDTLLSWYFGRMFRDMAAASNHWAILDRQTVFHLSSKYAVLLFQHVASLANLDHVSSKTFSVPALRAVLGVSEGKLSRFSNLMQKSIKPAIEEINHLSRFTLTATPNKIGRTVGSVTIGWQVKDDPSEAKRELANHSAGRAARRDGTVETEVTPFPQVGGFEYSPSWQSRFRAAWSDLGRSPRDLPDSARVADHVRAIIRDQGLNLDSPKIPDLLVNVVKNWQI